MKYFLSISGLFIFFFSFGQKIDSNKHNNNKFIQKSNYNFHTEPSTDFIVINKDTIGKKEKKTQKQRTEIKHNSKEK